MSKSKLTRIQRSVVAAMGAHGVLYAGPFGTFVRGPNGEEVPVRPTTVQALRERGVISPLGSAGRLGATVYMLTSAQRLQ